jgi:hypothetical protein
MNLLDAVLVALSLSGALLLGYRATRRKSAGGCHSGGSGKIQTGPPAPCAGCQSAVRKAKPGAAAR